MKVLLTGGSGQLGSYLLEELSPHHEVSYVDLVPPKLDDHNPFFIRGDIRDRRVMLEACSGVEAVFHLAAQVSVVKSIENPSLDLDINVGGTLNVLQAANQRGVSLFVHISTAAVYGDPIRLPVDESHPTHPKSFYGTSKLSAEYYVRTFTECFGLDHIIIRPFNLYSPRADPQSPYSGVITRFVENAKRGLPLTIEGDGNQTRDFIHAQDAARMLALCLESGVKNVTMNCASGAGTSIRELSNTLASVSPGMVRVDHAPPRVGDIRHSVGDTSRSRELLDFIPIIDLKRGLAGFFDQ